MEAAEVDDEELLLSEKEADRAALIDGEAMCALKNDLAKRALRMRHRATAYLLAAIATAFAGVYFGYVDAPDVTRRDANALLSESAGFKLANNRDLIAEIDAQLDALQIPLWDIALAQRGLTGVAVGDNGRIITTADGGSTWTTAVSGGDGYATLRGVAVANDGRLSVAVSDEGTIMESNDGGETWSEPKAIESSLEAVALSSDGKVGVAVGYGTVVVMKDGEWQKKFDDRDADLVGVSVTADGQYAITVGWYGTAIASGDFGQTWMPIKLGLPEVDLEDVAFLSEKVAVAVGVGVAFEFSRSVDTWKASKLEGAPGGLAIDIAGDESVVAVGYDGLHVTDSPKKSWTLRNGEVSDELLLTGVAVGYYGVVNAVGPHREARLVTWENTVEGESTNRYEDLWRKRVGLLEENQSLDVVIPTGDGFWQHHIVTGYWRVTIVLIGVFLAQILVGLNRYYTRLSAFYQARSDALDLITPSKGSDTFDAIDRMTQALSPERVEFGGTPKALLQRLTELAPRS